MILPQSDIRELTGYVRVSAQIRWLRRWGIRFTQNGLGWPIVTEEDYLASLDRLVVPGIPPGEETPAQIRAYRALFKRRLIDRCTPRWANREAIERFYEEARRLTAETGIPHAVDHIVPISGLRVSGLHVEANLQILTRLENSRKSNRWTP
jgi:hypothetical protein